MVYLPSVSADLNNIFIYEMNLSEILWDDDEECYYVDFSDEDYSGEVSVIAFKGDPNEYTLLKFEKKQWYSSLKKAKKRMYKLIFEGKQHEI